MVVRGGGENTRKTAIAVALSFIIVLLLAMPVSAGSKMIVVPDTKGDISKNYDFGTGEPRHGWGENTPVVAAGYFDIVSAWLAKQGKLYTFGMELATDLPQEGQALPCGINSAYWEMIIESAGPWDPYNPLPFAYYMILMYDGSRYSANLLDIGTGVMTPLPFTHAGPTFQILFSEDSIAGRSTFWWSFCVEAYFGVGGWSMPDNPDPGASPDQVYWDIPWPPA